MTLKTVVVIPTYNEVENLPRIVQEILGLEVPGLGVLVVDDGSPDGTGEVADKLAEAHPGVIDVLHRTTKDGLGRAYRAGMRKAVADGADLVVQMDADFSHPPTALPHMIEAAQRGAGLVIGSRYTPGGSLDEAWELHRRLLSRWANFYVKTILGVSAADVTAGFNLWSTEALAAVDLERIESNGYSFQVEMKYLASRAGVRIAEVPIRFAQRVAGTSKMSLGAQLESAWMPWRLRAKHKVGASG
ncbi:polyprenol monophosphomannose synthase [Kitasatospora sp. NBC_01287]|uniref:polyprenol monophosphomannose synthase n=1 Tax=Kitasatospora sp. NBC_01287 TaxID=2903573 RepID=UPI002258BF27|nr:polyprenol monophosphomannose synthase [Kitasatospora sp. NBC_01287]MCX4745276.1 polyprenol monophosphomannose synthase [Kitasatospora sp. NBC_01287]